MAARGEPLGAEWCGGLTDFELLWLQAREQSAYE